MAANIEEVRYSLGAMRRVRIVIRSEFQAIRLLSS